jgi:hypothetical protein
VCVRSRNALCIAIDFGPHWDLRQAKSREWQERAKKTGKAQSNTSKTRL